MQQRSLQYRADIDGLRAIAVLSVTLFHLDALGMTGGYVGVDIFFVISGYLITNILAKAGPGNFSFGSFYLRRFWRLFPALFSTTILTLLAGMYFLNPDRLFELLESSAYTILSLANFDYWLSSGYWGADAKSQPLLHTWSLSVEEQFYLVWPIIVLAALKLRRLFAILIVLFAIALAGSEYMAREYPSAAYFMTPFRVHQFAIGALCIPIVAALQKRTWTSLKDLMFLAGIALSISGCYLFNAETTFPGLASLLPSVATCLVICACGQSRFNFLLSNPVAVWFGRVSYSLYLVHWPVIVFARTRLDMHEPKNQAIAGAIMLALTVLQYYLVEAPLRNVAKSERKWIIPPIFAPIGLAAAAFAAIAVVIFRTDGLAYRYDGVLQDFSTLSLAEVNEDRAIRKRELCASGRAQPRICGTISTETPNVLVIGDSHGLDGLNIAATALPDASLLLADYPGCPLFYDLEGVSFGSKNCAEMNAVRIPEIEQLAPLVDMVIISHRASEARVEPTIVLAERLADFGAKTVILGAGPWYGGNLRDAVVEHGQVAGLDEALASGYKFEHFIFDDTLLKSLDEPSIELIQKDEFFCPDRAFCHVLQAGTSLTSFDAHHLTRQAAEAFGLHISRDLQALLPATPRARTDSSELVSNTGTAEQPSRASVSSGATGSPAAVYWNANQMVNMGGSLFVEETEAQFVFKPSPETTQLVIVPDGYSYEPAVDQAARLSGSSEDPQAWGKTGGITFALGGEQERAVAGRTIEIEVTASSTDGGLFMLAYSTADKGSSGWLEFDLSDTTQSYTATYDVPEGVNWRGDYVGIVPPADGALLLEQITLSIK